LSRTDEFTAKNLLFVAMLRSEIAEQMPGKASSLYSEALCKGLQRERSQPGTWKPCSTLANVGVSSIEVCKSNLW
jgi:hypothetical protein